MTLKKVQIARAQQLNSSTAQQLSVLLSKITLIALGAIMFLCDLRADIPVPEKLIEIVDFQVYNQDNFQLVNDNTELSKLFPNPSNHFIEFELNNSSNGESTNDNYDINANLVHTQTVKPSTKSIQIPLSNNTTGIYYFDVFDSKDNTILIKNSFIINN